MKVEIIIYFYGAVCISMVLFHFATILVNLFRKRRFFRRDLAFARELEEQVKMAGEQKEIPPGRFQKVQRQLESIGNLQTFEEVMGRAENEEYREAYLEQIRPRFYHILNRYRKGDVINTSYIVTVIRSLKLYDFQAQPQMRDLLRKLLQRQSIYLREAILGIFYDTGNTRFVMDALRELNDSGVFHHPKLIHDGMLTFAGDMRELQEAVWENLPSFRESLQVALLNFIRFSQQEWNRQFFALLTDGSQPDEIRFVCIRYFGNHIYPPAERELQEFVADEELRRWEYAAISAASLQTYGSERTKEILSAALSSSNWYVRFNSAQSLQAMGMTYKELLPVLDGNNRYAREIMRYWLDMREVREVMNS